MSPLQRRWGRIKRRLQAKYASPPAVPTLEPRSALELWRDALGVDPDPWQEMVLKSDDPRICLLCCRQSGKSQTTAIKAIATALNEPKSLILLVSRSLRQSGELARKVFTAYADVGRVQVPSESETKQSLELANGSRILALPGGDPKALRGFSRVRLLCIDEAARCPDSLWISLRPMVAVSKGSIVLLSTPFGRRGFFYRVWVQSERWLKVRVTAGQCPRLTPDFLQEERIELGERWYSQEYETIFVESLGQVYSDEAIDAAFSDAVTPLFSANGDDGELDDAPPLWTVR